MKKIILLLYILGMGMIAKAQWTSGSGTTYTTDNVGIGTTSSSLPLVLSKNITGDVQMELTTGNQSMYLGANWLGGLPAIGTNTSLGFSLATNSTQRLNISSAGNVGIGTTSPSEKLSVNGKIRAKEVKVESSGWPDYVFESSYKLPDLLDTERFIKRNGHLPEIPTAKEVEENGINLGEINSKLLKKIEELMLYMIEMRKENDSQQKEINQLKSKL